MKKLWPLLPSEKVAASEARVVGNLLTAAGTHRLHLRQPPGAHHLEKRGAGINVCEHDVLGWSRDRGRRGRCRAGLVESRCRTLGVQTWSSMLENWTVRSSTRDGSGIEEDVGSVAEVVAGMLLDERSISRSQLSRLAMRMVEAMFSGADDAINNALEVESLPAGLALEEAESLLPVTRPDRQLERPHCFLPNPTPSSSP